MMNRSGIETYELLRLDEVALAGYFDLEDTRFEEWYEKNRAVGDRLYSAILDRKIDLVAFRGTEDGRYYYILTRSPKQEGSWKSCNREHQLNDMKQPRCRFAPRLLSFSHHNPGHTGNFLQSAAL